MFSYGVLVDEEVVDLPLQKYSRYMPSASSTVTNEYLEATYRMSSIHTMPACVALSHLFEQVFLNKWLGVFKVLHFRAVLIGYLPHGENAK